MNRQRCFLGAVLLVSLSAAVAHGQDTDPPSTYGSATLKSGFAPDPYAKKLVAGGPIKTAVKGVSGYIAKLPDFKLYYTAGQVPLILYAESTADAILIVRLPDGTWAANDDGPGTGLHALLHFARPLSGRYDIWVGTRDKQTAQAVLHITERSTLAKTPPQSQVATQEAVNRELQRIAALVQQGKVADAVAAYEKLVPAALGAFGKDSLQAAAVLGNLGQLYLQTQQLLQAKAAFERSLEIREAKLGSKHPEVVQGRRELGILKSAMAAASAQRPTIQAPLVPPQPPSQPLPMQTPQQAEIAKLYEQAIEVYLQGKYAEALVLFERLQPLVQRTFDKNDGPSTDSAAVIAWLGYCNFYLNNYGKCEAQLLKSLQIREDRLGKDHPDVTYSLHGLAMFYSGMGQYARARDYSQRGLDILEKKRGLDSPEVMYALNGLAHVYLEMGQPTQAEQLLLRSKRIAEAKFAPASIEAAHVMGLIAKLYEQQGQFARAEPLAAESLRIHLAEEGKEHPNVAIALDQLADIYRGQRQLTKAEPLYQQAMQIGVVAFGKGNPFVALVAHKLTMLAACQGRWPQALALSHEAHQSSVDLMTKYLPYLSENEQLSWMTGTYERPFHQALSMAWAAPQVATLPTAEWLLNGKAIGFRGMAEQHLLARDARDPKLKPLLGQLQRVRLEMAALVNSTPAPGTEAAIQGKLLQLKADEAELTKQLRLDKSEAPRESSWVTAAELRGKLRPRSVFINIARITQHDFSTDRPRGPRYGAWVMPPPGAGEVKLVDLGDAEAIDKLVEQTRNVLIKSAAAIKDIGDIEATRAVEAPLRALSARVLHPLLPTIGTYEEWILCPDGALWLTPWNALFLPQGQHAVEKHLIRYVVSGRDLVYELPKVANRSSAIFADPNYDLSPASVMATANSLRGGPRDDGGLALRSGSSSLVKLRPVERLENTALEAAAIRPKLERWLGQAPQVFLAEKASETLVKRIERPRVLVLSTHGYFLPKQESQSKSKPAGNLLDTKGQPLENPLLRCGLMLAGCNKRAEAKPGEDDGILTGLEIVGMNLQGCELVVLSACETGLGDVRGGDGVAGLRQAFQLAGARGVLASLWQVPDRETALQMSAFYGELSKGRSQAEALRQAQIQRIAARREQRGAAHPFAWAAFTLTTRGTD